jgi:anti-sigma regulatory factor (Ser/Thr protein kinase)
LVGVRRFTGDAPPSDDIAILAIRHTGDDGNAPSRVRWSVPCDLAELAGVSERVIRFGEAHGLPDEVMADVRLALEEVLSNVIRHGLAGRREGGIHVQVALNRDAIALQVEDEGRPFDPAAHPRPDLERPFAERAPGGQGVHLVRSLMDEVTYRREGERNVLKMVKRLPGGMGSRRAPPPGGPTDGERRPPPRLQEETEMSLTVTVKEHGKGLFTVYPVGSLDSNTYQVLRAGCRR